MENPGALGNGRVKHPWLGSGVHPHWSTNRRGGAIEMPGPQPSPLLQRHLFNEQPSAGWLQLTESEDEFLEVLSIVNGTPRDWLESVEARAVDVERRGVKIEKPLAYRLSILWNGIIFLQETKYLCDLVETVLRQALVTYCSNGSIPVRAIAPTARAWRSIRRQYKATHSADVSMEEPPSIALLSCFTFYQLTETVLHSWRSFSGFDSSIRGFASLFWHSRVCRDSNLFRGDMKYLRGLRNDIAHTKRLLQGFEAERAYRVATRWLQPIGIKVDTRVMAYQRERPRFLETVLR